MHKKNAGKERTVSFHRAWNRNIVASTLKWTPSSYINQIQNDDIADSQQKVCVYIYIFDKSLLNHDT